MPAARFDGVRGVRGVRGVVRTGLLVLVLTMLAWLLAGPAQAGSGPENIAVAVLRDSWASRAIANEFVRLRGIPPANVVYIDALPEFERTDINVFREKILRPILTVLDDRGLGAQIDCLAYSSDFPWAVGLQADLDRVELPKVITPTGSLTGLTYLYPYVLSKSPEYVDLRVNRYFRLPAAMAALGSIDDGQKKRIEEVTARLRKKEYAAAEGLLDRIARELPQVPGIHFQRAVCLAALDKTEPAFAALDEALKAGFSDPELLGKEPAFAKLREDERFAKLVTAAESPRVKLAPTRGFSSRLHWNAVGLTQEEGPQYLLSTMLGVTSGRGNSVEETLARLRASAAADGTRPQGTFYFLKNADVRSKTRAPQFAAVVEELKTLKFGAEIVEGTLPEKRSDVLGAVLGSANLDWPASGSTMKPGAIVEHLTSLGGVLSDGAGQTPLTHLLKYGATGSSGTVTEPYALAAKFPSPWLQVHYAKGCSLAESFYQATQGPYQLLVVGDPLCRPFAVFPQPSLTASLPWDQLKGTIEVTVKLPAGGPPIGRFEWYLDGRRVAVTNSVDDPLEFDTTRQADGTHELSVLAMTNDALDIPGRFRQVVRIRNTKFDCTAEVVAAEVPLDGEVVLKATAPGADRITFRQHQEALGALAAERGELRIPAAKLGLGEVEIIPFAIFTDPDPATVRGMPVRVRIVPPGALAALPAEKLPSRSPGLLLAGTLVGEEQATEWRIDDCRSAGWLRQKPLVDGTSWNLSGWVEVEAGLHQVQAFADGPLEVVVDGRSLGKLAAKRWHFLPLSLLAGVHRLEVRGTAAAKGTVDLRWGREGTRPWAKSDFSAPQMHQ